MPEGLMQIQSMTYNFVILLSNKNRMSRLDSQMTRFKPRYLKTLNTES